MSLTQRRAELARLREEEQMAAHATVVAVRPWAASFRPLQQTARGAQAQREPRTFVYYNHRSKGARVPLHIPSDFPRLDYTDVYGYGDGTRFSPQLPSDAPNAVIRRKHMLQNTATQQTWNNKVMNSTWHAAGLPGLLCDSVHNEADVEGEIAYGGSTLRSTRADWIDDSSSLAVPGSHITPGPVEEKERKVPRGTKPVWVLADLPAGSGAHQGRATDVGSRTLKKVENQRGVKRSTPARNASMSEEAKRLLREERASRTYRNRTTLEDVIGADDALMRTVKPGVEAVVEHGKLSWNDVPRSLGGTASERLGGTTGEFSRTLPSTVFGSTIDSAPHWSRRTQGTDLPVLAGPQDKPPRLVSPMMSSYEYVSTHSAGSAGASSLAAQAALMPYNRIAASPSSAPSETQLTPTSRPLSVLDRPVRVFHASVSPLTNSARSVAVTQRPTQDDEVDQVAEAKVSRAAPALMALTHAKVAPLPPRAPKPASISDERAEVVASMRCTSAFSGTNSSEQMGFGATQSGTHRCDGDTAIDMAHIVEPMWDPSATNDMIKSREGVSSALKSPSDAATSFALTSSTLAGSEGSTTFGNTGGSSGVRRKLLSALNVADLYAVESNPRTCEINIQRKNRMVIGDDGAVYFVPLSGSAHQLSNSELGASAQQQVRVASPVNLKEQTLHSGEIASGIKSAEGGAVSKLTEISASNVTPMTQNSMGLHAGDTNSSTMLSTQQRNITSANSNNTSLSHYETSRLRNAKRSEKQQQQQQRVAAP